MEHEKIDGQRVSQLRFIGKILSVFTHELNNHLAIVKESAGLLDDILRIHKPSDKQSAEESLKITQSIENQIAKTSWIIKKLNGFGHRMDSSVSLFNVNECIEELMVLLNRAASQKKIAFKKEFHDNIPPISNDPLRLQFLLFCFIEAMLNSLDAGRMIIFRTAHSKGIVTISIILEGGAVELTKKEICSAEIIAYTAEQLNADIYNTEEGCVVTLPVSAMV